MNTALKRTLKLVLASLGLSAALSTAPAQARENVVLEVGSWKIIAVHDDKTNKLHRCLATLSDKDGMVRIHKMAADGQWAFSMPAEGFGNPAVASASYRALKINQIPFDIDAPVKRASTKLSPLWVDEFRKDGTLIMTVGKRQRVWVFTNMNLAMRGIEECHKSYNK